MNDYQEQALMIDLSARGRFETRDRDQTDLLHRMSTNNVNALAGGAGMLTVLTTPVGRIIDVLAVMKDADSTLVITGENRGDSIRQYLARNIFFNDRVKVTNLADETRLMGIYGGKAQTLLASHADVGALEPYHFVNAGDLKLICAEDFAQSAGYWIFGPAASVSAFCEALQDEGAIEMSRVDYDRLRIEAGYPATGAELTDAYIPLETGLWHAVSFSKGCYTGQEIIARMESRGKLAKMLMKLSSQDEIVVGDSLMHEGKSVGSITSVAPTPNGYIGLGYIKTAVVESIATLANEYGIEIHLEGIAGTQPERS